VCYEESSVADPLEVLLADGVIDEILGRLKSGKEANITLVRHRGEIIAAKVYKDRATRSFKNNADYKEGRKVRNTRTQRAMDGGGKFGREAAEQEWKSAESDALHKLIAHGGVRIPKPVMFYEGVLLMELVTDAEGQPAPRLIDVALDPAAAGRIYADLRSQIVAMLCCDMIHGDLSPYNILAAAAGPTIIDFPQVVSAVHSSRAEFFFQRDFDNVLRYVAGFDPKLEMQISDGRAIWRAYVARDLTPDYIPPPPQPRRWPDRRPDPRTPQNDPRNGPRRDPRNDRRPQGPPRNDFRGPPPRTDGRPPQDSRPPRNDGRPNDARPSRNDFRGPRNDGRPNDGRPPRNDPRPQPSGASRNEGRPPRGPRNDSRNDSRGGQIPEQPASNLRKVPPSALRPELRFEARPPAGPSRGPRPAPPAGGHRRRPKRHW
jgi:RIO kinase 1